jgi:hypothetical protein
MARDPWDSSLAAGVVDELLQSLNLVIEMSADEGMQPDAVMSKNAHGARVDIQFLIEELERLHLALSAGKNKAQTFAKYRKVSNLRFSVQDYSRETEISEDVRHEANVARELLRELDLIYF